VDHNTKREGHAFNLAESGAKLSHLEEEIDYAAPAASYHSRPSLTALYQFFRKASTAFIDIEPITPHGFLCGFLGGSGTGSGTTRNWLLLPPGGPFVGHVAVLVLMMEREMSQNAICQFLGGNKQHVIERIKALAVQHGFQKYLQ
jgi:hypothetical protein